jgi:D-alanyl-D-alanine carboxypeptidase/D-alanyl-D-alanine-endopeptidase (penicillin-binding protein 4)
VAPGTWGIAIANMDGQLLWGVQPGRPMIPASTVKLFTTGFARSVLGGEARKHTRVIGQGQADPGTGNWVGSWALELNGDPTLERSRGGPTLSQLASQLAAGGIRRLFGPLRLVSAAGTPDASYPDVWSPRYRGRTFAPLIGALTINENVMSVAVGPGAVGKRARLVGESPAGAGELVEIRATTVSRSSTRLSFSRTPGGRFVISGRINARSRPRWYASTSYDPRALLEASWARALKEAGIEWIRADVLSGPPAPGLPVVLAAVNSEPFDSIASEVNRRSSNLGAELLLRWAAGGADPGALLTAHVQQITGELTGVRLVDGSGLSRDDRATPLSFISYLTRFPLLPAGRGFFQLLPSNGVGTLRQLARGLPAAGVVRAKTGTLGDVATLAGYLGRPEGVLVISLMYNGARPSRARQEQWKLFRLLGADGMTIPDDSLGVPGQLGGEDQKPPAR